MIDDELAAVKMSDIYGHDFGSSLRHTLCNLLRVGRGAGRPYRVTGDLLETLGTLQNYRQKNGHDVPPMEIASVLSVPRPRDRTLSLERQKHEEALDLILCGALQIVASRWVNDTVREQSGWDELASGVEDLVGVRPLKPYT